MPSWKVVQSQSPPAISSMPAGLPRHNHPHALLRRAQPRGRLLRPPGGRARSRLPSRHGGGGARRRGGLPPRRREGSLGRRGRRRPDVERMSSWVPGADGSGFGLENLPFGVVGDPPRPAVRVGDHALVLAPLADAGLLGDLPPGVLAGPVLNPFLALGRPAWSGVRARLAGLLRVGAPETERTAAALLPL